jgi:hypothetical protein
MFTPQAGREESLSLPGVGSGSGSDSDCEDTWPAPGATQRFTFSDICNTPLFMTQEEATRKAATNDTLKAMASFIYDGKSPLEIAALLKDKANGEMKKGAGKTRARAQAAKKGYVFCYLLLFF